MKNINLKEQIVKKYHSSPEVVYQEYIKDIKLIIKNNKPEDFPGLNIDNLDIPNLVKNTLNNLIKNYKSWGKIFRSCCSSNHFKRYIIIELWTNLKKITLIIKLILE